MLCLRCWVSGCATERRRYAAKLAPVKRILHFPTAIGAAGEAHLGPAVREGAEAAGNQAEGFRH
jgi:hypothetical protein